MPAPKDITRLIEQFEPNAYAFRLPGYNETQCRREFIDPFFMCLGWSWQKLIDSNSRTVTICR